MLESHTDHGEYGVVGLAPGWRVLHTSRPSVRPSVLSPPDDQPALKVARMMSSNPHGTDDYVPVMAFVLYLRIRAAIVARREGLGFALHEFLTLGRALTLLGAFSITFCAMIGKELARVEHIRLVQIALSQLFGTSCG